MPRPKGSKNKVKTAIPTTTDFAALIAEKAAAKESLTVLSRYFRKKISGIESCAPTLRRWSC